MYLGVHFPGDVAVGIVCGIVVGTLVWLLFSKLTGLHVAGRVFASSQYTRTGYLRSDVDVVMVVLVLTLGWCMAKASLFC